MSGTARADMTLVGADGTALAQPQIKEYITPAAFVLLLPYPPHHAALWYHKLRHGKAVRYLLDRRRRACLPSPRAG